MALREPEQKNGVTRLTDRIDPNRYAVQVEGGRLLTVSVDVDRRKRSELMCVFAEGGACPTFDEMLALKEIFWGPDDAPHIFCGPSSNPSMGVMFRFNRENAKTPPRPW